MDPIEKSLDNMADISVEIMKKAVERGELTQADALFLAMYQKEKARAVAVPIVTKIISGMREVVAIIKECTVAFAGNDPAQSPLRLDEAVEMEVDTDAL